MVNLLPLPTVTGAQTNNYIISPSQTYSDDQFDARGGSRICGPADHHFRPRRLRARCLCQAAAAGHSGGLLQWHREPHQNALSELRHWRNAHLQQQPAERLHASPSFAFGVGTLGYNSGKNISEGAGIPNANRGDAITSGLSLFNISGYGFANTMGGPTYVPELVADNTYQVADSVILIHGKTLD